MDQDQTPISYAADIMPMFRDRDFRCMSGQGVPLDDAAWMCDPAGDGSFPDHANARRVHARIADGSMPPDLPWSPAQVSDYERWMAKGFAP